MPRRNESAIQRVSLVRESRPEITVEDRQQREEVRRDRMLHSGMMRRVAEAVIASGAPIEIETETHIVTMTATPK